MPHFRQWGYFFSMKLRNFLRLQTDTYLTTLRDKLSSDISSNVEYTSLSMGNKSTSTRQMVKVDQLAEDLAEVLIERGLQGSDYAKKTRMTRARFT